MNRAIITSMALLLAAVPALAGTGNSYLGKEAPEIQTAKDWINRPANTTVADCKGEVLLLEFFATW